MSRRYSISVDLMGLQPEDMLLRPADIPCPDDSASPTMTSYGSCRMALARTHLSPHESPARLRRRLQQWWTDISAWIVAHDFGRYVNRQMADASPAEHAAIWWWTAGDWHEDRDAMTRILWRTTCCTILVSAAHNLHLRAEQAEEQTPYIGATGA